MDAPAPTHYYRYVKVLGLSYGYHDSGAALLVDGVLASAAHEERFSRSKNDASFPERAIAFCLRQGELDARDLDAVVFHENPLLKLNRVTKNLLSAGPRGRERLLQIYARWITEGRWDALGQIATRLNVPRDRVHQVEHHQAHAASAFFCSPFEEATVVTLDGVGEDETATVSIGRGSTLEKLASAGYPHSLGLFYSVMTAYLGFRINEGEYKVMGMAPFGTPRFETALRSLFCDQEGGLFELDQRHFDFHALEGTTFRASLEELLGPARKPGAPFVPRAHASEATDTAIVEESQRVADIAASAQKCAESIILRVVRSAIERTGIPNLCLAGGVALNSVANGRIEREVTSSLFVQPAAGDAGAALGAALHYVHAGCGLKSRSVLESACVGPEFGDREIDDALSTFAITHQQRFETQEALISVVAKRIAEGQVIGWFQGRAEFGPRALGSRSILAHPGRPDMQQTVNMKIKFREGFRPFAPSVLKRAADQWFELCEGTTNTSPDRFMLSVMQVREERRSEIPAITHVDGTARVHIVNPDVSPLYHQLIECFAARTGLPMLLNTSFNLKDQPMVGTPQDALDTFLWCDLDALVLGPYLIEKRRSS